MLVIIVGGVDHWRGKSIEQVWQQLASAISLRWSVIRGPRSMSRTTRVSRSGESAVSAEVDTPKETNPS